jgi:hypothetical protein
MYWFCGRAIVSPVKRVDSLAVLSLADYADPAQQPSLGTTCRKISVRDLHNDCGGRECAGSTQ